MKILWDYYEIIMRFAIIMNLHSPMYSLGEFQIFTFSLILSRWIEIFDSRLVPWFRHWRAVLSCITNIFPTLLNKNWEPKTVFSQDSIWTVFFFLMLGKFHEIFKKFHEIKNATYCNLKKFHEVQHQ